MKSIYIAGPITNDPDYEAKFDEAARQLAWKNWIPLNPAILPKGLNSEAYMPICLAMVNAADAIVLLNGHENSAGACIEKLFAIYQGKPVYFGIADVPGGGVLGGDAQ